MDKFLGDEVTWRETLEQTFVCAERLRLAPDAGWLMSTGGKVLTMQAGFGLLEAAMTRKMNAANIMMKNVGDLVLGAIIYYFLGYNLAFGKAQDHGFAGSIDTEVTDYAFWFFQFSFAATAATIDSGTLAERCNFFSYVLLSTITTGIIYPISCHWAWGGGFLSEDGFMDFAGGTVVHALGASGGMAASLFCGPRLGRFKDFNTWRNPLLKKFFFEKRTSLFYRHPIGIIEEDNFVTLLPITNPVQTLFGTLLLWMGWYGFNGGSTLGVTNDMDMQAAKVFVTTTLGAAFGGLAGFLVSISGHIRSIRRPIVQVPDLCTGILGGLVCITAGCAWVSPVNACVIGFLGGSAALWFTHFLENHQVDDVVSAIPVHGCAGIVGTILVAFFAEPDCAAPDISPGIFYGGDWSLLGSQLKGILAICSWGFFATYTVLSILEHLPGLQIRAERWDEIIGMDLVEHFYDDNFDYMEEQARTEIIVAAHAEPVKSFLFGTDSPDLEDKFQEWDKKMHATRTAEISEDLGTTMAKRQTKLEDDCIRIQEQNELNERRFKRIERGFQKRIERLEGQDRGTATQLQKIEIQLDNMKKNQMLVIKALKDLGEIGQAGRNSITKKPSKGGMFVCITDESPAGFAVDTIDQDPLNIKFIEDYDSAIEGEGALAWIDPPSEVVVTIQSWWRGVRDRMKPNLKNAKKKRISISDIAATTIFGDSQGKLHAMGVTDEQILQLKTSTKISKQGGVGRAFHATTWRHDTCGKHFPEKPKRSAGAGSGGWMGISDGRSNRGPQSTINGEATISS